MSAATLAQYIDKQGLLRTAEGLRVTVGVIDARERFGRLDFLVAPLHGSNRAWVSADRVELGAVE